MSSGNVGAREAGLEPTWPVHIPDGTGISHILVGQMYSRHFQEDMHGNGVDLKGGE